MSHRNGMNGTRASRDRTGAQVLTTASTDGQLGKSTRRRRADGTYSAVGWERKVRQMRRDPTLAFLRDIYAAPILASEWTVVTDSPDYDDAIGLVWDSFVATRWDWLEHAVHGLLDFGWQAFEKVQALRPTRGDTSGGQEIYIEWMKPLLQDTSYILVDAHGSLVGVECFPPSAGFTFNYPAQHVDLSSRGSVVLTMPGESMVFNRDVEGTDWYGQAVMYAAEAPYDAWNECEVSSSRYDRKIAGAHWVVHYPLGSTTWNGRARTPNLEIARAILASLEASGSVAIPRMLMAQVEELNEVNDNNVAWKVEILSAPGSAQSTFTERQKYQDALKARAIRIPERAVLEGQFGTKAEAEAHADFAIDNIDIAHRRIVEQVNRDAVDPLLVLNRGRAYRGAVRIVASPLSDVKRAQLRQLYTSFLQSGGGEAEYGALDIPAIREELGIPARVDDTVAENLPAARSPGSSAGSGPGEEAPAEIAGDGGLLPAEFKGLSRRDWNRYKKAIQDVREGIRDGSETEVTARVMLESAGMHPDRAQRMVAEFLHAGRLDVGTVNATGAN